MWSWLTRFWRKWQILFFNNVNQWSIMKFLRSPREFVKRFIQIIFITSICYWLKQELNFLHPFNSKATINSNSQWINSKIDLNQQKTNQHSLTLKTSFQVISEAQKMQHVVFNELLRPFKYAILLDLALQENKGDPAITTGELILLQKMDIKIVSYCYGSWCTNSTDYSEIRENTQQQYDPDETIVLLHGGGNLFAYDYFDEHRRIIFEAFGDKYHFLLFPQSISIPEMRFKSGHVTYAREIYVQQSKLIMMMRDLTSLNMGFKWLVTQSTKSKLMLMPDMAFQIGPVPRTMAPVCDILWLHRKDIEAENYTLPNFVSNVTVIFQDWYRNWGSPTGNTSIEDTILITHEGLKFLQRGRVVITDRLHGHILSTLLDIPHVLLDTQFNKVKNYHNTWTSGLESVLVADNASHALELALILLDRHKDTLPEVPIKTLWRKHFRKSGKETNYLHCQVIPLQKVLCK